MGSTTAISSSFNSNSNHAITVVTDCSTGYGQIFAWVAINAINYAVFEGIHTGSTYDKDKWKDIMYIWNQLHNSNDFNLRTCAFVLLHAANLVGLDTDYYGYTESETKKVLSRYYGTNTDATRYGNETYQYYQIFEKYNKLVRDH